MNTKEIRGKVTDFFRSRRLPAPDKLSDESVCAIFERWVSGRSTGARSFTRGAQTQLRAVTGAESAPATPVAAPAHEGTDSLSERERRHLQAIAVAAL